MKNIYSIKIELKEIIFGNISEVYISIIFGITNLVNKYT